MVVIVIKTDARCCDAAPYTEGHYSPHLASLLTLDEFNRCKKELDDLIQDSFPETSCLFLNSFCGYFSLMIVGVVVGFLLGAMTCNPSHDQCQNDISGMFGMVCGLSVALLVSIIAHVNMKASLKELLDKIPSKLMELQQRNPGLAFEFIHIPELLGMTRSQYMIEIKASSQYGSL